MPDFTIRDIVSKARRGEIRIPAFQRGFVWDPDAVARFMDSIYKDYPYGSLLFWRTKQSLRSERTLGPFALPERDPDYPVDYVLDGQQRVTSIFGVFERDLPVVKEGDWTEIYFDFKADQSIQESQFMPLIDSEVDRSRHFPLNALFDTVSYRAATLHLSDEQAKKIDEMQAKFKEAQIPVQIIETENRASVAIIFERINRQGIPLDTLQLLSAWTWSEEFDLQEKFAELSDELRPFGFAGEYVDNTLLLRCCAAVIARDASPETLVNLDGAHVRARFDEVANGIKGAIDFLRGNLRVEAMHNLPFTTILVPLSVFFAAPSGSQVRMTSEQRRTIVRWFWKSAFSRRYSSGVLRNLRNDIAEMANLKNNHHSDIDTFKVDISPEFFLENVFGIGRVNTKTFVLLLAQSQPLSFVSGSPVALDRVLKEYNRNEFHHVFPRRHLRNSGVHKHGDSVLANYSFLSKVDNSHLGGAAPVTYRSKMAIDILGEILTRSLLPPTLFEMTYDDFVRERAELLAAEARRLMA